MVCVHGRRWWCDSMIHKWHFNIHTQSLDLQMAFERVCSFVCIFGSRDISLLRERSK